MKTHKPIILTFVAYYLPGYKSGGPLRSIANMVEQLGDEFDFRIVTSDRDSLDIKPYKDIKIDTWNTVGKAKVFYISPKNRSLRSISRLINKTQHDILYLNSFFSPIFTIKPLLARRLGLIPKLPIVIAARGEFSEGALALKSWKKRSYLLFSKMLGLHRNLIWQASSEFEVEDIQRTMGTIAQRIIVAPDLPSISKDTADEEHLRYKSLNEPFKICFLSRISPMKNLDYALEVLAQVKVPVEFNVYGGISDIIYWEKCQKLINNMPSNVKVNNFGIIDHKNVYHILAKNDLFFLPTCGENYGHVIHEALSAGLPVLISDQTPWRKLTEIGVGWDLPLKEPEKFARVIEKQSALNDEARILQRLKSKKYAHHIASDQKILSSNRNMFKELLERQI